MRLDTNELKNTQKELISALTDEITLAFDGMFK